MNLSTTLPDEIMEQITKMVSFRLKKAKIDFELDGTKFYIEDRNQHKLFEFQAEATKYLIEKGIITKNMILKENLNILETQLDSEDIELKNKIIKSIK